MQISTTPPSPSQADTHLNLFMLSVQERAKLQISPRGETKVPKEQIRITHVREHLHLTSPGSSLGPSAPLRLPAGSGTVNTWGRDTQPGSAAEGLQGPITTCAASYNTGLFPDFPSLASEIAHHASSSTTSF